MTTIAVVCPTTDLELHEERIMAAVGKGGEPDIKLYMQQDGVPRQRYTRVVNRGIKQVLEELGGYKHPWDYICLLNDDCEPQTDNWLAELVRCFQFGAEMCDEGEAIGYVAPGQPCRTQGMMEAEGPTDEPQIRHIFAVPFGCVLIRREVFTDVGLLDPSMTHYCSDTDHQYRARAFGWQSVWAPHVWVHRETHDVMMDLWQHDRMIFNRRWGGMA